MKNKQINTIGGIFSKHLLKDAIPSVDKIIANARKKKTIKLVYGETYDRFGITIDSLKYYLYLSILHRELEKIGLEVTSFVIVGDLHSVKNQIVENKDELLAQAKNRVLMINDIKSKYDLSITPILMSSFFKLSSFKAKLNSVKKVFDNTPKCKEIAKKTVLQNRLAQEEKAGYQYTIEEVSLIVYYDIKIGPPREVFFDRLARLISTELKQPKLSGIYLRPTYPLGLAFDYFVQHPEVEEYGLTPYKAGSNQLKDNRLVLDNTIRGKADTLIDNTFASKNIELSNPLLDLLTITDLAKSCLVKNVALSDYQELIKDTDALKDKLKKQLELYIFKPFGY